MTKWSGSKATLAVVVLLAVLGTLGRTAPQSRGAFSSIDGSGSN
ncbi:MAG TPA: hypothetical protein V6D48_25850 [Oculatellaceae cyanobacterium]